MLLENLKTEYDNMQKIYGDPSLHSIYFGGKIKNPDICFVFMNPTGKNIASNIDWNGIRAPWVGTKTIWDLFVATNIFSKDLYNEIKSKKPCDWTEEFANIVYNEVAHNNLFITNLGKCTQIDAKPISNAIYKKYLTLLEEEISIVNPKVIILFGNQVSTVFLNENISVSKSRKKEYIKVIKGKEYKCYSVFYPVGNGRFNINKAIEDINFIKTKITQN